MFKLRTLLDRANEVNLNCTQKLSNGSRTLQIIQSRLQYKQQQYTAALLNAAGGNIDGCLSDENEDEDDRVSQIRSIVDEDDTETYVSATSVRKSFPLETKRYPNKMFALDRQVITKCCTTI